jgi:molecular chaperone DnaK (HSP70)
MDVGIDYGTTYSSLCFSPSEGAKGCITDASSVFIPSVLLLRYDNTYDIGTAAMLPDTPGRLYRDVKRWVGLSPYRYLQMRNSLKPTYPTRYKNGVVWIGPVRATGEKTLLPVTVLVTLYVKALVALATSLTGKSVNRAVCSVPAAYDTYRRSFMHTALDSIGVSLQAVVNEPTAAAFSEYIRARDSGITSVLVYDFGGGTFDVSLAVVGPSHLAIVYSAGDDALGGRDVDNALQKALEDLDSPGSAPLGTFAAERVKVDLSINADQRQHMIQRQDGTIARLTYTRAQFEQLCAPFIGRTVKLLQKVATINNVTSAVVLLVGGSSTLPGITRAIKSLRFVADTILDLTSYRAAVAIGAGLYVSTFTGATSVRLLDTVAGTLSDENAGFSARPLVPKGYPMPCTVALKGVPFSGRLVLAEGENKINCFNDITFSATVPNYRNKTANSNREDIEIHILLDGRIEVTVQGVRYSNDLVKQIPAVTHTGYDFKRTIDAGLPAAVADYQRYFSRTLGIDKFSQYAPVDRESEYNQYLIN